VSSANTPSVADVGRFGTGVWPKPSQEQIVVLITVIIAVVFGLTLPGFASIGNLLPLLRNVAILLAQDPEVVIFHEPTRGVDVGAIREIRGAIRRFAVEGNAVVVISWCLPEVISISERILVGRIVAEFDAAGATEETMMYAAIHGAAESRRLSLSGGGSIRPAHATAEPGHRCYLPRARSIASTISAFASAASPQPSTFTHLPGSRSL
jgi:hypothetical protein